MTTKQYQKHYKNTFSRALADRPINAADKQYILRTVYMQDIHNNVLKNKVNDALRFYFRSQT